MNIRQLLCALSCAGVLGGAVSGCATNEPAVGQLTDTKITTAVEARINHHPDLGPPDTVSVVTRDKVVYLSGFASTSLMKQTAEDVARNTPGVNQIVNNIAVSH